MKNWLFIFLSFFLISTVSGQVDQTPFLNNLKIQKADLGKLYLGIENYNLFKNNEYFNNIQSSITIFGSAINSSVKYYPSNVFLIEAGIHLLTYYGTGKFDQVTPIIRINYQAFRNFNIVFGNIYGGLNHGFIEPLYQFERFFEDTPETGLQILYKSNHFNTDLYIDWRKYIYRNSFNDNEILTFGWVNKGKLFKEENPLQIEIPLQILVAHKGGQVDTTNLPTESLLNLATGISIRYRFNSFISELGATFYYATYQDISEKKEQFFDSGYGIYPLVFAKSKWLNIYLGYWNASQFIGPLGEPLFSSISYIDKNLAFSKRELILFKFDFNYKITRGLFLGVRYEGYYDILGTNIYENISQYDFSFVVYINFTRDFFLTGIKKFK